MKAPFAHIENFMQQKWQEQLLDFFVERESEFMPAQVGANQVDTEQRVAVCRYANDFPGIDEFLLVVGSRLPAICSALDIEPIVQPRYDLQLQVHLHGGFHKPHPDHDSENRRKIAFVYYFCMLPKQFEGGELLIYNTTENAGYDPSQFQRIPPTHNSIVFFPVQFFHEVTPVISHSDGFKGARLSLGGWIIEEG